ncbi:hypothetical protein SCG7086_AX_00030 [Chlamydiales bacterium SCGC AG-110-P3]|nr:hypothetical protein SCG7086_AX_00030 [Chlamydiales bacterium SCGC AG-110-P3]
MKGTPPSREECLFVLALIVFQGVVVVLKVVLTG